MAGGFAMKKLGLFVVALALLGAKPFDRTSADEGASPLSTDRKVHGVITSIAPSTLTIASQQRAVTGKMASAGACTTKTSLSAT